MSFSLTPILALCHTWCNISSININFKVDPQPIIKRSTIECLTVLLCSRINKGKVFYYKVFKIVSQTSITVTDWIFIEIAKLQNNWLDLVSELTSNLLRIWYQVWGEKLLAKKQSSISTFEPFHVIYFLVLINTILSKIIPAHKRLNFSHTCTNILTPLLFLKSALFGFAKEYCCQIRETSNCL